MKFTVYVVEIVNEQVYCSTYIDQSIENEANMVNYISSP